MRVHAVITRKEMHRASDGIDGVAEVFGWIGKDDDAAIAWAMAYVEIIGDEDLCFNATDRIDFFSEYKISAVPVYIWDRQGGFRKV